MNRPVDHAHGRGVCVHDELRQEKPGEEANQWAPVQDDEPYRSGKNGQDDGPHAGSNQICRCYACERGERDQIPAPQEFFQAVCGWLFG